MFSKVDCLVELIKHLPNLERLSLTSNIIEDKDCQNIADALIGCLKLKYLYLPESVSPPIKKKLK